MLANHSIDTPALDPETVAVDAIEYSTCITSSLGWSCQSMSTSNRDERGSL
jgi:hypothetical protein